MKRHTSGCARTLLSVAMAAALTAGAAHAADIAKGARVYAQHCASCHGAGGTSVMPGAPNFSRNEGLMQPDITLLNRVKAGRNAMPAYAGILSDREVLDVIAFLRTLR